MLHTKKDSTSSALTHDIHFWQGSTSSQDEIGSVAVFAAQLDEFLGDGPVQHRQVQGSEEESFLKVGKKVGGVLGAKGQ